MARFDEKHKSSVVSANLARAGVLSASTQKKLIDFEIDVLIPHILRFYDVFFNKHSERNMSVRLSAANDRKRYSWRARPEFDKYFTIIVRAGRNKVNKKKWPTYVAMNLEQRFYAVQLLKKYDMMDTANEIANRDRLTVKCSIE